MAPWRRASTSAWAPTLPSRSPAAGKRSPTAAARPSPRAARPRARSRSARRCAPPAEGPGRDSAFAQASVESLDEIGGPQRAGLFRLCGGAVLDDAERGGVERRHAVTPATADPAGEHVAGACGGERGVAGGADPRRFPGRGDDAARALEHDRRPVDLGEGARPTE